MTHPCLAETLDLLGRLVEFDTVTARSNVGCAEWIADRLEDAGWRLFLHRDSSFGVPKVSVVAWTGPEVAGGLIVSGHMDVVPFIGQPGWTGNPLVVDRRGDRVVGRGVADMKGFLAECLAIAPTIEGGRLDRPLVLILTCDEEEGCLGAERLLPTLETLRGKLPLPTDCVIGEPTAFQVYRAHKGHVRLRITSRGRGGHSSRPDLGVNAISATAVAAREVDRLAADMRLRVNEDDRRLFPAFPAVPFNLGLISGGTADNMIAERCELVVAFRQGPGSDPTEVLVELERRVREAVRAEVPRAELDFDDVVVTPAMSSPADAACCRELCDLAGVTQPLGAPFATDGGQLERIGIRSWICGPGELEQAHQPDESISVEALDRGLWLVESLIEKRCRRG